MTKASADGSGRRRPWRIGRLLCGLAAVIAVLAAVPAVILAQGSLPAQPEGQTVPTDDNAELAARCGLRVQLVLDESGSIVSPNDEAPNVRGAARAFVTALAGTGSRLAITAFQRTARQLIGYETVTPGDQNTFFSWINGRNPPPDEATVRQELGYNPEAPPIAGTGGHLVAGTARIDATNWEDALKQVLDTGAPNLVVFITDGDPTTYNTVTTGRPPVGTNTDTATPSTTGQTPITGLNRAVTSANAVKAARSRIFAIGVGPAALGTPAAAGSRRRLQAISGTTELAPGEGNFPVADWTALPFGDLQAELTGIVGELCAPSLTVTKLVPDRSGTLQPTNGWRFDTTLTSQGGSHTWVVPHAATNGQPGGPTGTLRTGHNPENEPGIARFEWNFHGTQTVTATIQREERTGFHFVSAQCTTHPRGQEPITESGLGPVHLGPDDFATCQVVNRPKMATVTVVKSLEPSDDPGKFHLHIGSVESNPVGDNGKLTQTLPVSAPGERHVSVGESPAAGTELAHYDTSISCVDLANPGHVIAHTPDAAELSVPLTGEDGQEVLCTITNRSNRFGEITVIKDLIPADDPGKFHLHITPGSHVSGPVGHGGRLGPIRLPFGTYHVTETAANGTNLGHYNISTECFNENSGQRVADNAHGPRVSVHLTEAANNIECTITNHRPGAKTGHLEVVKHLVPHVDVGTFDLLVGGKAFAVDVGHNGTTGPLEFELGTHTVTERGAEGTGLAEFSISTTCVNNAGHTVAHNAHGPRVSVDLGAGANIVCTITNKRIEAPPGGGEDIPPPPDPDPHLSVVKRTPAHAQVGELVPITVTVHNFGHGTAHGVQLHENRPPGLEIVHVADHGTLQHGTAVWHLGDLKQGESRTVHATARVLRTGSHVDTAVATALNADPALSVASVRAAAAAAPPRPPQRPRPPHPPPPQVTG